MQCSVVGYSIDQRVYFNALQHKGVNTVSYSVMQCSAMQCSSAVQCSAVQCSAVQCSAHSFQTCLSVFSQVTCVLENNLALATREGCMLLTNVFFQSFLGQLVLITITTDELSTFYIFVIFEIVTF